MIIHTNLKEKRTINGTNIEYSLDRAKRKNSYIQIKEGNVILKVPNSASEEYINELLAEKILWIKNKLQQYEVSNHKLIYEDNSNISVLGKKLLLKINFLDTIKRVKIENNGEQLIINYPLVFKNLQNDDLKKKTKNIIDNYYKSIAKEEVFPAMEYVTSRVGLYPKEVHIKNLKATWGICSSKKYISINQNLMMFSRHAIEYVCLHEVCHLKYMNHSSDFWNMVEYYMPDYRDAKNELRN